ncbi:MAG TPA: hypothetical protein DDW52_14410 [Planctomycetaceae bacterium]|nr:hypothetical protein [Planctomycetaceae bacterium]
MFAFYTFRRQACVWLTFVAACLAGGYAPGHDLPLGHVERDMQVVAFPDRIEFQYTIEMGAATMRQMYTQLREESLKNASKKRPALDQLPEETDAAWHAFREAMAPRLAANIRVMRNGKSAKLKTIESETVFKHTTSLSFVFETLRDQLDDSEYRLEVHDRNFVANDGYHRVAIKGRRGLGVTDSTTKVTVSQIDRTAWSKLSTAKKRARVLVHATVGPKKAP